MIYSYFLPLLLVFTIAAYYLGMNRARSAARASGGRRTLHSLPGYYGIYTAIRCAVPALVLYGLWQVLESTIITSLVTQSLPLQLRNVTPAEMTLVINDIKNVVSGDFVAAADDVAIREAADTYLRLQQHLRLIVGLMLMVVAALSAIPAYWKITPAMKARNAVEKIVTYFLLGCSAIAVLTTIGIIFSVLFEAIRFFKAVPITDFLFGL
ncbi:MAG TPA: phosphate ABC transporter permease family protein, partial [Desulfopila sp.]|nr:phosphate ABC transporter permease family protein [Desulfopila sp.]